MTALAVAVGVSTAHAAEPATDLAAAFGAREAARGMAMSPLGTKVLFLSPNGSAGTAVIVVDVASGKTNVALAANNNVIVPIACHWKTEARVVCTLYGVAMTGEGPLAFTRVVSVNADGSKLKQLGQRSNNNQLEMNQRSGDVIDWLPDDPSHVLMQIDVIPQITVGSHLNDGGSGASVQRVDINTAQSSMVVSPNAAVRELGTDGRGAVRFKSSLSSTSDGYLRNGIHYFARASADAPWKAVGSADLNNDSSSTSFEGFDESGTSLYQLRLLNGRHALYKVAADGSGISELVFAHPIVDVDGVHRIGKYDRPVAARYSVDGPEFTFFDPTLLKLTRALSKALPGHPGVVVLDESWDQTKKLIAAEGDGNPGTYYLYSTTNHELNELLPLRPQLKGMTLGTVTAIKYPAADGTLIPAYLTLPPGVPAKGLRTVIMPHGGPSARDTGGFDWWAQYYVKLGYAVLQPNFRGSSGYGEAWYRNNGFKSWATAIGDVNDGARWLIAQGIADPARLAIVGWSYGGYAALQANVLDPTLYKAAIAVAPVTDLDGLRERSRRFVNFLLVSAFIGEGPHVAAGSPARNAGKIQAPVLMFSGDRDLNVDVSQSRLMDSALARAGKVHELKIYPGLDHQLDDTASRIDMLRRSASFLDTHLK